VERWLTTGQAAVVLGTSTTTIRKLAAAGQLTCRTETRPARRRWLISEESALRWLAENGRIDERRQQASRADGGDGYAEMARLRDDNAVLRDVTLRLRARNDAVSAAEAHQARAVELLGQAMAEQAAAAAQLRLALTEQDDALGQLLTPGAAQALGYGAEKPPSAAPTA
jgi:excisionase family DNA binding protein